MPRYPRLFLPNAPLHVVQRGHDRQPVFVETADYQFYLDNLIEMKDELEIQVYGYCLMTNHVHLILAPGENTVQVSKLLRVLAGRQTRRTNRLENRSGTLWEGRFKASLIDSDNYLLACYRYVDLNPVRAFMVTKPEDYLWSSYVGHTDPGACGWLDDSPTFLSLGTAPEERGRKYRSFVARGTSIEEAKLIRTALQRNQVTGTERFRQQLEQRIGRRLSARGQGRPRLAK